MSMNPFVKQAIGAFVRWALTIVAAWLVQQGVEVPEISEELVLGITTGVVTLLWSLWQKRVALQRFFSAAAESGPVSLNEVKMNISLDGAPSALTPANRRANRR